MKDKLVIEKLHLLKSIEPDAATLRLIRRQISPQQPIKNSFSLKKWFIERPFVPLIALASFIIIFMATISVFPNFVEKTFVYAKIFVASNHYEKAKIALINFQDQIKALQKNPPDSNKIKEISNSLALANTEMSGLQLVGEKGKYTSYQCEELYESYHDNLSIIESTYNSNYSIQGKSLSLQAAQYDKQAIRKLKNYRYNNWQK